MNIYATRLGKYMFERVEGKNNCVRDDSTGIEMTVGLGFDYSKRISIGVRDGRNFSLTVGVESKFPERPFVLGDASNPTIQILMGSLDNLAREFGGPLNGGTEFIRTVLQGLSALNRFFPFSRNPFFYSDRNEYAGRESTFHFVLPSEDEIAKL